MRLAFEVGLVSFGVNGTCAGQVGGFFRGQGDVDLARNCLGHFRLQGEHIAGVAFVTLRPEMGVGGDADQLCGDAHSSTATLHGTLQDALHS